MIRGIGSMRLVTLLCAGFFAASFALHGVAQAADTTVAIQGFAYSPATVSITVGDTVTWSNSDAAPHTVT
ncbi:MAG TPA: hypothetical protein PKC19_16815, partial [Roseiflexaceae bacterium]|nr:hypothetical protein [Roseiflexaceae bacterium]